VSTRANTIQSANIPLGSTSNRVVKPDQQFEVVKNMVRTESGGLVNVPSPTPWLLTAAGGIPTSGAANVAGPVYGETKGVFHAVIGNKDIMLLHTGNEVWSFQGWTRGWRCIIGPSGANPMRIDPLNEINVSEFPTQFVATTTGVVIVPQEHRAYYFDGVKCLPLGYDRAPGPPIGLGPESTTDGWAPDLNDPIMGVNDDGYTLDGLKGHEPSYMFPAFRYGRIGTISTPGNIADLATNTNEPAQIMGYLEPGRWTCRAQWIDAFGNLSPWSSTSNEIKVQRQPSMRMDYDATATPPYSLHWISPDCVQKQFAWDGIQKGPDGTIARNLARTKDLVNSGTARHFELPLDSSINVSAIATLPDNVSDFYPDNIPDAWLVNEVVEYDPVPAFRLAAVAFGRLWIANWPGAEGALRASLVGRFGTFRRNDPLLYPDPSGGAITALYATQRGLLVFTRSGTFLLDSVDGMPRDISRTVGCMAPSSIATMRNGMTVWLARDGFYGWVGGDAVFLWEDHRRDAMEINMARASKAVAAFDPVSGEYRCWLPCRGSYDNNRCWTFDGVDWHYREDIRATGVCMTKDHRNYMITCGTRSDDGKDGVWALDRDGEQEPIMVRTGWIRSQRLGDKASIRRGYLLLRETGVPNNEGQRIAITSRTNYRVDTVSTTYVNTYPDVSSSARQQPAVGVYAQDGTSKWGDGKPWRIRRVYRAKFDLDLPSCDVFQLEFTCNRRIEILGVSFEEQDRPTFGAANVR
jgi:hypothetical protein